MKLNLYVLENTNKTYIFQIEFENDAAFDFNLPVTAIRNSIDRVGMVILHDNTILEPVDFNICALTNKTKDDVTISPGQKYILEITAALELIQEKHWSLAFENARYLVNPNIDYKIYVHWDVFKSNKISWNFSTESAQDNESIK